MSFLRKLFGAGREQAAQPPAPAPPAPPPVDLSRAGELLDCNTIDWNAGGQREFVTAAITPHAGNEALTKFLAAAPQGGQLTPLDAAILFAAVSHFEPTRLMAIGAGQTTLLLHLAKQARNLPGELIAVDPAPDIDLTEHVDAHLRKPPGAVPIGDFQILQEGELLFIDFPRVYTSPADTDYLLVRVLPALNRGVLVGFHGISLPRNFSADELTRGATGLDQLRDFLSNPARAQILFSGAWTHENQIEMPEIANAGRTSALWFRIT